jgi:hypothetical protein
MRRNTLALTAAAIVAAGAVGVTGAAVARAAADTKSTPSPSSPVSPGDCGDGHGGPGGASQDTPVTGDEADKVIAAVEAEDSSVTIDTVRKDPDGSYDALGTTDGNPVFFDVSADLSTVTENTGGPGGGHGVPGEQSHNGSSTSTDSSAANTAYGI